MGKSILRVFISLLILVLLCGAAWAWFTLNWTYSEGERAGYVQKFSRKGWLCKTWEGEIAMVTMPGAIPEKFDFTVRDEAVAKRINELAGSRLVLHYQQHKFVPTTCFGDTEYYVVGVKSLPGNLETPTPQIQGPKGNAPTSPSGATQPAPAASTTPPAPAPAN